MGMATVLRVDDGLTVISRFSCHGLEEVMVRSQRFQRGF